MLVARLRNTVRRLDELSYRGLELRSNIGLSYRALAGVAQRLFRRFALITTPDFPGWTAAALLDTDPYDALEVVESLVEAQLLDTVQYPGERLRYRFHDLIRVYAAERLHAEEPEDERAETVERLLGAWLARAEHAHRKEYGGDYTILHGTAPRWSGAAELEEIDEMGDQMEWLEAERRSLVSAVHLAADYGMSEACWDLALTSVTLFQVKGHFDDWRRPRNARSPPPRRRATGAAVPRCCTRSARCTRSRPGSSEAGRCLPPRSSSSSRWRTTTATRSRCATPRPSTGCGTGPRRPRRSTRSPWRRCGRSATRSVRRTSCSTWPRCASTRGMPTARRQLLETALACCQQVKYLRGEAQVLNRFAELHLFVNQVEQAHQALNRVLLIVRDIGDRIGEAHALYRLGVVRQRSGRLDNAETTLQHALSLAQEVGERMVAGGRAPRAR